MVIQIESNQELHKFDTIKADAGLDNSKEIRDAMRDQAGWKDFVRMA